MQTAGNRPAPATDVHTERARCRDDSNSPSARAASATRFPLELTPEESHLLERATCLHPSKGTALLAGLVALAESEERTRQEDTLARERDLLQAELTTVQERAHALELDLARATAKADLGRKRTHARERRRSDQRAALDRRLAHLERALARERKHTTQLEEQITGLENTCVDWLRCFRCREWIGPDDWAVTDHDDSNEALTKPADSTARACSDRRSLQSEDEAEPRV